MGGRGEGEECEWGRDWRVEWGENGTREGEGVILKLSGEKVTEMM